MNATRKLPWLLVALVTLVLALVAAGCGGDDEEDGEEPAAGDTTGAEDTTTAEGEPIRVGLVTDIGGLNDRGFNSLANQGLERAASELGVEIRVLESKSDADYIPNLSTLAEEGFDLIISVGFLMGEATHTAAEEFPDTSFAIIDFAYGGEGCEETNSCELPNLQGLLFKEQETGYLAGYLAGLVTESNTISSVGGLEIPPVVRFIAGYQAGAKASNPDITTLNAYSQDFVDQAKCKEVALDQIAEGSDVVFQVAGGCGLGALDAAQQEGVWGIGVDADQAFLGDHVLTSALKRVDEAVFQTIQQVVDGAFAGGSVTLFGLAEDGVGLGEFSPNAPQDAIDETLEQVDGIVSGETEVPENIE
ncbi:MAG TPA: BMP family ABC transporter substrate-binding protein [Gaiellaceae bacterium]|nr:BMP family ABC transporter substrate-binding protein [Gaiellaceae bacterium]